MTFLISNAWAQGSLGGGLISLLLFVLICAVFYLLLVRLRKKRAMQRIMLNIDQIYMIHYTPLTDRKKRILKDIPLQMKWIESEPSDQYWTTDQKTWDDKVMPYVPYRHLKKSEISFTHKHIDAYKDMVKNHYQKCLVFEDDVILSKDFVRLFNLYIDKTPKDWDFIFIGSGCNLRISHKKLVKNQIAYKVDHPASKCTDSYCITLDAAAKCLNTIIPFTFPMDFELNYQMKHHELNVYWWEPPLVKQGSQHGLYRSAIQC